MWYNPATWTAVDNLQGQNNQQQTTNSQMPNGAMYYNGTTGGVEELSNGQWQPYDASQNIREASPVGGGGGLTQAQIYAQQQAAERARQEAADNARRAELRGGIRNLINSMSGVYDLLHGDINSAAAEQRQGLQDKYNKETGSLTDQFNQEMPVIGRGWAARGAYDSSYRTGAEGVATDAYGKQIQSLGDEKIASEGKIGQWAAQQRANIEADRGGVSAVGAQIDAENDINVLTQLKNQIDAKLRDNQAKRADYTTQGAARQALVAAAPTTDNSGALGKVLVQIIQGQAPRALKIATAKEVIGSSGLTEEEKARLSQQVETQVS